MIGQYKLRKIILRFAGATLILLLALALVSNPAVSVRVVDAAGRPVAGAIIKGEGLGTKTGTGAYGWTTVGWGPALDPPKAKTIVTGPDGKARIPYPRHLSKGVETGTIKLLVDHPDFVPNHSECVVAIACPRELNWKPWAAYFAAQFARRGPIVLQKGATVRVTVREDSAGSPDMALYVQVADWENEDTNVWTHPEAGVVLTQRLPAGNQQIRAVAFDKNGWAWFSDVIPVKAVSSQTNELTVSLKQGATLHGKLDASVPRPIANGRVTASVWSKEATLHWHTWAEIRSDGTFELGSLPPGEVDLVVVCDGFVSANGKMDFFGAHYSQRYSFDTNDLTIELAMEPTVTLEVQVTDDRGRALKDAKIFAGPSVRYIGDGEGVTAMLGADCFDTAEVIREGATRWLRSEPVIKKALSEFHKTTDSQGRAQIRNLPIEFSLFKVEHDAYVLPEIAIGTTPSRYNVAPNSLKLRVAKVKLVPNQTNFTTIRLERK